MSKRKELFKPKLESKMGMYNCTPLFKPTGVTAYDFSHIGHARFYINFDLLFRQKQTVEKGPDILRSAQEGDSSGHAESLPATLAEHQQHSANFQQSEFGVDASHIGEGELLSEVFIRSHGEFRHTSSRKTTSSTPTPGNDLEPSELASLLQFRAGELITE